MGSGCGAPPHPRHQRPKVRDAAQVFSVSGLPHPPHLAPRGPCPWLRTSQLAGSGQGARAWLDHVTGRGLISHIPSHGGSKAVRDRNAECPLAELQGLSKSRKLCCVGTGLAGAGGFSILRLGQGTPWWGGGRQAILFPAGWGHFGDTQPPLRPSLCPATL